MLRDAAMKQKFPAPLPKRGALWENKKGLEASKSTLNKLSKCAV